MPEFLVIVFALFVLLAAGLYIFLHITYKKMLPHSSQRMCIDPFTGDDAPTLPSEQRWVLIPLNEESVKTILYVCACMPTPVYLAKSEVSMRELKQNMKPGKNVLVSSLPNGSNSAEISSEIFVERYSSLLFDDEVYDEFYTKYIGNWFNKNWFTKPQLSIAERILRVRPAKQKASQKEPAVTRKRASKKSESIEDIKRSTGGGWDYQYAAIAAAVMSTTFNSFNNCDC